MSTITVVPRPGTFSIFCPISWSESFQPNTLKSPMEAGPQKVRRIQTGITSECQATWMIDKVDAQAFKDWFFVACQGGVLPTYFTDPMGVERVFRFNSEPSFTYNHYGVLEITMNLYQSSQWADL